MSASDYLEQKILEHLFKATSYTAPATVYVSLHTGDPTEAAAGANEVSGNGYARQAVAANTGWSAIGTNGTAKEITNAAIIQFPTPTPSGWSTVTYFGVYDAVSAGNLLVSGALTQSKTINPGDDVEFPIGSLAIRVD